MNFDFISKLPGLSDLRITGVKVSVESLISIGRSFGKLSDGFFSFRINDILLQIRRIRSDDTWKIYGDPTFETGNPDKILDFFVRLKSSLCP